MSRDLVIAVIGREAIASEGFEAERSFAVNGHPAQRRLPEP